MANDNPGTGLERLKMRLSAARLTRREAVLYAIGATCPLLLGLTGKDEAMAKRCAEETCKVACYNCSSGCAGGGPNR